MAKIKKFPPEVKMALDNTEFLKFLKEELILEEESSKKMADIVNDIGYIVLLMIAKEEIIEGKPDLSDAYSVNVFKEIMRVFNAHTAQITHNVHPWFIEMITKQYSEFLANKPIQLEGIEDLVESKGKTIH